MSLPFTRAEFFDLFAAYNAALWPVLALLWVASVVLSVRLVSRRRLDDRLISALLAAHWIWSAVAYHAVYFTRINPAAWLFAGVFALQAGLLVWDGVVRRRLSFVPGGSAWTALGWVLVAYSLLYPAVNAVQHQTWLHIPAFGVPCPTTIFTAGMLLLARPRSWRLAAVPVLWSAIGGSAAVFLDVHADYALPVAGLALTIATVQRRAVRRRHGAPGPVRSAWRDDEDTASPRGTPRSFTSSVSSRGNPPGRRSSAARTRGRRSRPTA